MGGPGTRRQRHRHRQTQHKAQKSVACTFWASPRCCARERVFACISLTVNDTSLSSSSRDLSLARSSSRFAVSLSRSCKEKEAKERKQNKVLCRWSWFLVMPIHPIITKRHSGWQTLSIAASLSSSLFSSSLRSDTFSSSDVTCAVPATSTANSATHGEVSAHEHKHRHKREHMHEKCGEQEVW